LRGQMETNRHMNQQMHVWLAGALVFGACLPAPAQVQWMRQGGLSGEGRGMATDAFGNAYTVGTVGDPALFDGDTSASHFADAFIAKYDADGLIQWVRTG